MFCHLYWFAAATQGKFFLFWNSNIYVIKIKQNGCVIKQKTVMISDWLMDFLQALEPHTDTQNPTE